VDDYHCPKKEMKSAESNAGVKRERTQWEKKKKKNVKKKP